MLEAVFVVFIAPVLIALLMFGVLGIFGISFTNVGKKIYNTTDEGNTNEENKNNENQEENKGRTLIKILYWIGGFVILVLIIQTMGSVGFPAIIVAFFIILRLFL